MLLPLDAGDGTGGAGSGPAPRSKRIAPTLPGEAEGSRVGEQPILHIAARIISGQVHAGERLPRQDRKLRERGAQVGRQVVLPPETALTSELQRTAVGDAV